LSPSRALDNGGLLIDFDVLIKIAFIYFLSFKDFRFCLFKEWLYGESRSTPQHRKGSTHDGMPCLKEEHGDCLVPSEYEGLVNGYTYLNIEAFQLLMTR